MGSESWHQPCYSNEDSQYYFNHLHSEFASVSSQTSFRSVPSLATHHQYDSTIHHHCITTLKGQSSYISSIAIAGEFLYTGSSDREIRSWKRNNNHLLNSEPDHDTQSNNLVAIGKGAVKSLIVLSDKLYSAHQDHKIRVWKIDNHESNQQKYTRVATLPTLGDRALKLLVPKNHVQIRRHKKSTWVHHVDTVSALALSRDETLLYSVSWDRTLKIWSTSDFKCLESIWNAHDDAINAVASSNDGSVYTGSADKRIKVWKKIPGEKKHSLVDTLEKHNSGINALALSTDGSVLYSGSCDRSIVVWETGGDGSNMVVVGALRGHTKSILCLATVSDLVCSGSADNTVRVWRCVDRSYFCLAVLEGHRGPVKCLTAAIDRHNPSNSSSSSSSSSSSYIVYSGSLDCDIKVWQVFVPHL